MRAGLIVVAAGAVQTPLLFQRNKLGNSSGQIGLNFACHPSLAVFGEHENDVYAWVGATLSAQAGDIENPLKGGYLLEAGMVGPVITSAWIDGGVGSDFVEFMENSKKFQAAVTLIHDHNVGRVYLDGDRKRIEYDLDDRDFESMREALRGTARIYFAAGARRVYLPTTRKTTIESADQVDSVINSLQNGKHMYRITSYHPQGTMRMGARPQKERRWSERALPRPRQRLRPRREPVPVLALGEPSDHRLHHGQLHLRSNPRARVATPARKTRSARRATRFASCG